MTIKEKFSSIDQSKLTAEQKSFLSKIKNVTKNFSIEDKDVNDKVEGALDKMITTLKDKMPEAIKSTSTARPKKRSVMSVAKDIRKDGEDFTQAKKRATKKIAEDKESAKETIKSELDKLNDFIKSRKTLSDIKGTNLLRDAKRKAKPVGRRLSKTGRVYYEYRDSKTDRLSPNYPKNAPYLEMGGGVNDKEFSLAQAIAYIKEAKKERMSFYYNVYGGDDYFTLQPTFATPTGKAKGFPRMVTITKEGKITGKNLTYELGGSVVTDLAGHTGGGNGGFNARMPLDGFSNTAYTGLVGETGAMSSGEMFMAGGKIDKNFDLSGYKKWITFNNLEGAKEYVDMDRKKYPRVKESVVIKEGNRFQVWVIPATGVETGNRVYANGGSVAMANQQVINDASQGYVNYYLGEGASQGIYKVGGVIKNQYAGRTPENVWDSLTEIQRKHFLLDHYHFLDDVEEVEQIKLRSLDDEGKEYINNYSNKTWKKLSGDIRKAFTSHVKEGQYAKGGSVTNERLHVNKAEDYEVRYSKPRPARKGYLGKRDFAGGGGMETYKYTLSEAKKILGAEKSKNEGFSWFVSDVDYDGEDDNEQEYGVHLTDNGLLELANEVGDNYAKGGGVRKVGNREYSYGRNWTNDHRHVNDSEEHEVKYTRKGKFLGIFAKGGSVTNERLHVNKDEDYEVRYSKPRPARKGYLGKRDFMAGGMVETPKIYVADLEAYNNGRLVGEWLDLTDYNDADELMDAIQEVLKKSGGEEYAIHDYEYLPSSMYSEYMGYKDFVEIYEMMDLANEKDLPLDVVMDIVSQFDRSALDEFQGVYDSEQDFAEELVDDIGITSFNDFQYYLEISETDRRLLAQEEADTYVDDIRNEDGGNRLIEEADLDVEEYEEADSDRQEEMLDEAREIVYDRLYDRWYDSLDDPYSYLVEELGYYDADSFADANFIRVDYEKLADALEQDYTFVRHDGQIYVFNII
jgi:antirestriction protein